MKTTVLSIADVDRTQAQQLSDLAHHAGAHFFQSLRWNMANSQTESRAIAMTHDKEGNLCAASFMRRIPARLRRYTKLFVDGGPIFSSKRALSAHLHELCAQRQDTDLWLKLSPYSPLVWADAFRTECVALGFRVVPDHQSSGYTSTIVVDLSPDIHEIETTFSQSFRRHVRKGESLGLGVRRLVEPGEFRDFEDEYGLFAESRGLPRIPAGVVSAMASDNAEVADSELVLYQANHDGRSVAGIAVVRWGSRSFFHWGYSSRDRTDRRLPLSHLLHWHAIRDAKAAGSLTYDLGGYWQAKGKSDPINRFKLTLSSEVVHLVSPKIIFFRPYAGHVLGY